MKWFFLFCLTLLASCSSGDESSRRNNQLASYIDRHYDESIFVATLPVWQASERYPWDSGEHRRYSRITKEFFRCRGCATHPTRVVEQAQGRNHLCDCGGGDTHGLPVRNGKEWIYPILIDLANYIQEQSGKRVVITSGHRCPEHNSYVDPSSTNASSKHLVGAEATFYVEGMENRPEDVLALIFRYYRETPKYGGDKAYTEFARYDKDTDVSTPPWYNKEVFVKVYQRCEGRNIDNSHAHPYLSVQVRYDWDRQERVQYSWKDARAYFRY